ncbi:MAG: alpha/beta hydrolase [Candidatus Marinimicrobia bacterium]|nr:alpha/beta hydrolase [Candidatus Neomarinimicrobiota bacterium]MBL7046393.1 alpha/beta hydrolase [Candidatus Neomarinimicrobiota bacterium]
MKSVKYFLIGIAIILMIVVLFTRESTDKITPDIAWASLFVNDLEGYYLDINDIRMYYEIHGSGEPILLLHSGFAFIESFYKQIPAFSKHFRVIAPDRRGHGRSSDSDVGLNYSLLASDMKQLLSYLKIDKVSVVGWRDGGNIGIQMAIEYPDLVKKLILVGSNFNPAGLTEEIINFAKSDTPNDWDKEASKWYKRLSPTPGRWEAFRKKVKEMWLTLPDWTRDDLTQIEIPTMIIVGENDVVKYDHTLTLHQSIPNSDIYVINEATHFAPIEKPKEFNRKVIGFIKL